MFYHIAGRGLGTSGYESKGPIPARDENFLGWVITKVVKVVITTFCWRTILQGFCNEFPTHTGPGRGIRLNRAESLLLLCNDNGLEFTFH